MSASQAIPAASGTTPEAATHRRDALWLAVAVLLCLVPFLGKAYHIDDPMILWAAQRILEAPLDFYGFDVNWHGTSEPMFEANKNPPLTSFYVAGVGGLLGFQEWRIHFGMLLPALGFVAATWALARRLSASPRSAALATLVAPAVLVSSTTVMSESLLGATWCAALWMWLRGLDERDSRWLVAAAVTAGLCALTKYLGIALVPLLAAVTLARERRVGAHFLPLAIPLAMLVGYEFLLHTLYGQSALLQIAGESTGARARVGAFAPIRQSLETCVFLGGSALFVVAWSPWLVRGRARWWLAGSVLLLAALLPWLGNLHAFSLRSAGPGFRLQFALFAVSGAYGVWLAGSDLWRSRNADALLLALWVGGIFFFAAFLNWTLSVRALVLAVPALAILCVRALERRPRDGSEVTAPRGVDAWRPAQLALLPVLGVSLAVAVADWRLAEAGRRAAEEVSERYTEANSTLWFQGGWGFQFYMEAAGAKRLDYRHSTLAAGDTLVFPTQGSNVAALPIHIARPEERLRYAVGRAPSTMNLDVGAGFYANLFGPLPYAFGRDPGQIYEVFRLRRSFQPSRDSWERPTGP